MHPYLERYFYVIQCNNYDKQEALAFLRMVRLKERKLEVKIYKGKEGIKNVFEDILRSKPKEWLSLGSGGETYKVLPYFLEHFHKARVKNKIIVRGLLLDNPTARKRGETLAKMPLSEIRYLPKTFLTPTVMSRNLTKTAPFTGWVTIPK